MHRSLAHRAFDLKTLAAQGDDAAGISVSWVTGLLEGATMVTDRPVGDAMSRVVEV